MPGRKKTTWVVIADGARARIVATEGPGTGLVPLREMESAASRTPSRELGVERPGRAFESADVMRHAIEPRVDWHRFEKQQFARDIAAIVDNALGRRRFDTLVLVRAAAHPRRSAQGAGPGHPRQGDGRAGQGPDQCSPARFAAVPGRRRPLLEHCPVRSNRPPHPAPASTHLRKFGSHGRRKKLNH